jgi:hypothetical protein
MSNQNTNLDSSDSLDNIINIATKQTRNTNLNNKSDNPNTISDKPKSDNLTTDQLTTPNFKSNNMKSNSKKQNKFPSLDNKDGPLTTHKHYDDKNKDNQIKDILRDYSSKITPTVISPMQLGTQNEFGGTSGITDEQLNKIRKVNNDNINYKKNNYTKLQRYDYDKQMAVENEPDAIDRYNRMINIYDKENEYKYNIYHLSLQQILINMVETFIVIFNEILYEIKYSPNFTLSTIINIFSKSDRLFYVGLFLIFISIFLMIVELFN